MLTVSVDYSNMAITDEGSTDLDSDSIFRSASKFLNSEVLLYLFEELSNLPPFSAGTTRNLS